MSNQSPFEENEGHLSRHSRFVGSAAAKLILYGEHAVVYGRPAIAVPLTDLRARVTVEDVESGRGILFDACDLALRWSLAEEPENPLSLLVANVLTRLSVNPFPDLLITIRSTIPVTTGMGSGAAVATAIVRALVAYSGMVLSAPEISSLVYESELHYHSTPSGIDNTVVSFEQPILFMRREAKQSVVQSLSIGRNSQESSSSSDQNWIMAHTIIKPLTIAAPLTLVIGDTGIRTPTKLPVSRVRQRWQEKPTYFEPLFDAISIVVERARGALSSGDVAMLGALLNENQALLGQIGVSSEELDTLIAVAREAGALGAKLSGGGLGGVMFAIVEPHKQEQVAIALASAGAVQVLKVVLSSTPR